MATFKLEIRKQYGKFQARVWPSGQRAPEFVGDDGTLGEMMERVQALLDDAGVAKGDTVVFRNVGWDTRAEVMEAVRTAVY